MLQASLAVTAAIEPQNETAPIGLQDLVGMPTYGGGVGSQIDATAGLPFEMSAPCFLDAQYEHPWLGHEPVNLLPSLAPAGGFHYLSPQGHTQQDPPDSFLTATGLPDGLPADRQLFPCYNEPYDTTTQVAMTAQEYLDLGNGSAPISTRLISELDSSVEDANGWVLVEDNGRGEPLRSTEDAARDDSRSAALHSTSEMASSSGESTIVAATEPYEDQVEEEESPEDPNDTALGLWEKADSEGLKRRPRRCLNPEDRKQTSDTRKLKACIRCRMQKIRVSASYYSKR